MLRNNIRAGLVALIAIAALALPASALATNVTRWSIEQQGIASTNDYAPYAGVPTVLDDPDRPPTGSLGQLSNDPEMLGFDSDEEFGIDLGWSNSAVNDYEWEFIRPPGTYVTPQISAGQPVALYDLIGRRYLVDGNEAFGINLVWSTTPRYEWHVAKGGDAAHPLLADLYDTTEQGYLIDHWRTFGADLGWIHAPFSTGPDYIPPTPPVSTGPGGVVPPPPAK